MRRSGARRAQSDHDRSGALLNAIIEASPAVIYAKDLDGRMLLANGGALGLIGKPWSEVQGRTDGELLADAEQAGIVMSNDRRIMASGQAETVEEVINDAADATLVWLSTKTPFRDENGRVIGLVGVSVDVTERRRLAGELAGLNTDLRTALAGVAKTEREFRAGFELAVVGKLQADPQGRILRTNKAFAEMLGYEPDEMVGMTLWSLTYAEDRQGGREALSSVFNGFDSRYVREKRYIRRDGSLVWARVSAVFARSPDDAPYMLMAVVENIDERHKAQIALAEAAVDLEQTVVDRTIALNQRDLLLREVYHRVKNNLQIIDSMLVMQSRQLTDLPAKAAISSLRSRVFALGLVHHQLMGSADLKTFDIAPFLDQLVANLSAASTGGGITFTLHASPMAVGLDFAIPLGLLVTELVTNSLKHAFPGGEGIIDVSLTRRSDGTIDLVVADNGRGYDGPIAGQRRGLGTDIVVGLVAQLEGHLVFDGQNGARTEVHFAQPGTP